MPKPVIFTFARDADGAFLVALLTVTERKFRKFRRDHVRFDSYVFSDRGTAYRFACGIADAVLSFGEGMDGAEYASHPIRRRGIRVQYSIRVTPVIAPERIFPAQSGLRYPGA